MRRIKPLDSPQKNKTWPSLNILQTISRSKDKNKHIHSTNCGQINRDDLISDYFLAGQKNIKCTKQMFRCCSLIIRGWLCTQSFLFFVHPPSLPPSLPLSSSYNPNYVRKYCSHLHRLRLIEPCRRQEYIFERIERAGIPVNAARCIRFDGIAEAHPTFDGVQSPHRHKTQMS